MFDNPTPNFENIFYNKKETAHSPTKTTVVEDQEVEVLSQQKFKDVSQVNLIKQLSSSPDKKDLKSEDPKSTFKSSAISSVDYANFIKPQPKPD